MNPYLTTLLNTIGIDTDYLQNHFLSATELAYLDSHLASEQDFDDDFHTYDHGERLECLLFFLTTHKEKIKDLMQGKRQADVLIELYTSSTISGEYDCFRFDLSKFPKTYIPRNQKLTLYRVGRNGESAGDLGCSWAKSIDGLIAYCDSSGLSKSELESRPAFTIEIDDSQVLFEVERSEHEVVLKPGFTHSHFSMLDGISKNQLGR